MFTLFKKEINSFLNSLIGYISVLMFLLIMGFFLWGIPFFFEPPPPYGILNYGYSDLNGFFILAPVIFLLLIPAITMRSFAEEAKSGTLELLMTQPLTDSQVVLAKFFAGVALVIFSLLPTLVYFFSVYRLGLPPGNLDSGAIWGSYIGLLFLGITFVSIGIFASSITENQIVSFIVAVTLSFVLYMGFEFIYTFFFSGTTGLIIQSLGINAHYTSMSRGVIDTRDLVYFISVSALFLLMTKLSLESRKW
jgi:ABC-2 type transport system permease protein